MDSTQLREEIIAIEWDMFQATNNKGGRASCQDDYTTFYNMRRAQFDAWSDLSCQSYLNDLQCARDAGRNPVTEKYLNMMKNTHPSEYEMQKHFLPDVTEEKATLVKEISDELIAQTLVLWEKYPLVSGAGRPLYSSEDYKGVTSVQTYQQGEYLTYSEETLALLKEHLLDLKAQGRSLAEDLMTNTVKSYGFTTLEEAEAYMQRRNG